MAGVLYLFTNHGFGSRLRRAVLDYSRRTGLPVVYVYSTRGAARPGLVRGSFGRLMLRVAEWRDLRRRETRELRVADVNSRAFRRRIGPADHGIIAGFNQIFDPATIDRFASLVNLHPSILPYYRGPVPSYWCMKNGERRSGFTLHRVTPAIDRGEILYQDVVEIDSSADPDELDRRIAAAAVPCVESYLAHVHRATPFRRRTVDAASVYRRAVDYAGFPPERSAGAHAVRSEDRR